MWGRIKGEEASPTFFRFTRVHPRGRLGGHVGRVVVVYVPPRRLAESTNTLTGFTACICNASKNDVWRLFNSSRACLSAQPDIEFYAWSFGRDVPRRVAPRGVGTLGSRMRSERNSDGPI